MSGGKTVVELRVHGVSGTSPEAMLNCPTEFLQQMSGDKDAGFFRRAAWIDEATRKSDQATDPSERDEPKPHAWRRVMEVYSWGGLTSRRASRALWLLLLPFTLINLAHWMLPPAARPWPAAKVVALLRLLALSFTVTLLLASVMAVLDLAVWQCASLDYCSSGWGPLAFLERRSPGVRLALGALPLAAVIGVLWFLGRGDMAPGLSTDKPPPAVVEHGDRSPLCDQTFWNIDKAVRRMRSCHVTVWTSGLAALVLAMPLTYATSSVTRTGTTALMGANLTVFVIAVGATASNTATGRGGPSDDEKLGWLYRMRWLATALLAISLLWVGFRFDVPYPTTQTSLKWLQLATLVLMVLQIAMLIAIYVGTRWSMRPKRGEAKPASLPDDYAMSLGGRTAPAVALVGWLVGGGLSVGLVLWTVQILGTLVYSERGANRIVEQRAALLDAPGDFNAKAQALNAEAPLVVAPQYVWAAFTTMVMIVVAALVGAVVWWRVFRAQKTTSWDELTKEDGIEGGAPESLLAKIATNRALASLTNFLPMLLGRLAMATLVVFVVISVEFTWGKDELGAFLQQTGWIANISVVTTAAIVVGLVLLVIQAVRNRQVRRVVGILWDVATFWPRANHPLTPPSYGARTVWDLRVRLGELTYTACDVKTREPNSSRVVLVAHSQGTIIAAAALMQASDPDENYSFLTFGSPLRRLYACNFPAYFGYEAMVALRERGQDHAHRWINLWSWTDPIGGNIFNDKLLYELDGKNSRTMADSLPVVDCRILDVQQQNPDQREYWISPTGSICGHSGFWLRDEYVKAVDALQAIVAPEAWVTPTGRGPDSSATVPPRPNAV